jgi:hypothetical protein
MEEIGEWRLYFLFPVSLFLVVLILFKNKMPFSSSAKGLLVPLFLAVELSLYFNPMVMLLSAASFAALYFINKKDIGRINETRDFHTVLPAYSVYLISSLIAVRICYWQDFNNFVYSWYGMSVICIAFLLIVLSGIKFNGKFNLIPKTFLPVIKFLIPAFIFGLAALRVYDTDYGQLHHWGCYVGPAELVRQGGYLLWNVPSQYGFLSILSIVVLPFKSCWESFYVLQIIFLLISSMVLFVTLYASNKTIINYWVSMGIAFISVFLIPGYIPGFRGVSSYPSSGPFRFLWVQVILFFIVFQYRKKYFGEKKEIIIGSLIWLVSTLWAFEVAYYVSFSWFGYLLIKSVHMKDDNAVDYKITLAKIIRSFSIPVFFFLISLAVISAFYLIRSGHLPDWLSYYEYVLSFKEGFDGLIINAGGAIGVPLIILFFIVCFISERWTEFRKYQNYIAVLAACLLSLYACLTYFIGRSHENNLLNLMPLMVLIIAIISLLNNSIDISYTHSLLKYFSIPLYIVIIVLTLGNRVVFVNYLASLRGGYLDIQNRNPPIDPELKDLMISAGISEKDSIAYMDNIMLMNYQINNPSFTHYNHWLPMNPMTVFNPLRENRIEIYMERFGDQFKTGGYFIKNKPYGYPIEKFISHSYDSVGSVYENAEWKIMKFVRKSRFQEKQ